jgi:hypothetical protein
MEEFRTVAVPSKLIDERETVAKLLNDYEISNVSTYIGAGELSSPLCREDSPRILTPTRVSHAQWVFGVWRYWECRKPLAYAISIDETNKFSLLLFQGHFFWVVPWCCHPHFRAYASGVRNFPEPCRKFAFINADP